MKTVVLVITLMIINCLSQIAWSQQGNKNPELKKLSQQTKRNMMLGSWYGELPTNDGSIKKQIINHDVDGRYRGTHRSRSQNDDAKVSAEIGYWGISGDVYFTIFLGWVTDKGVKQGHAANPSHYTAYHIINFNEQDLDLMHAQTGMQYSLKKVSRHLQIPD